MADEGMILATIRAFWKQNPGAYLGRTKLQKLCYFARKLKVPYDLRYRMYFYGPYSSELDEESVRLQLEGLVNDEGPESARYSNYKLTQEGVAALSSEEQRLEKWLPTLELVAKAFGGLPNEVLELLATVKFIFDRLKKKVAAGERREAVVREVLAVKGEKFKRSDAEKAYDSLMEVKLLAA